MRSRPDLCRSSPRRKDAKTEHQNGTVFVLPFVPIFYPTVSHFFSTILSQDTVLHLPYRILSSSHIFTTVSHFFPPVFRHLRLRPPLLLPPFWAIAAARRLRVAPARVAVCAPLPPPPPRSPPPSRAAGETARTSRRRKGRRNTHSPPADWCWWEWIPAAGADCSTVLPEGRKDIL